MKISRKLLLRIIAGLFTSGIFCFVLVQQIMAGGVGKSISFLEFLKAPENILFCLLMSLFVFASWLMKGTNNRVVLFCWAIAFVVLHILFWWLYNYFYYQFRNIYVLNLAGAIGTLPAVLFLRYRMTYSVIVAERLWLLGVFRREMSHYLQNAKVTDFELQMKKVMYAAFIIEFLYGSYLSLYSLYYQFPYNGSLFQHMLAHNNWDPFNLYNTLVNIITVGYLLIICFYLFRDRNYPDVYLYGVTKQDKQEIAQEILEEIRRKKKAKEDSKKRDQD